MSQSFSPPLAKRNRILTRDSQLDGGQAADPANDLRGRLRADLREAMKTRDTVATGLLRRLIALIDNAEAVALTPAQATSVKLSGGASEWVAAGAAFGAAEVPRKVLSADDLAALLRAEAEAIATASAEMDRVGRPAEADIARAEAALLQRYLD